MRSSYLRTATIAALAAGAFGCAGNPPAPTTQMELARSALNAAQSAGAPEYAPVEFRTAQEKFNRANTAVGRESYAEARQLAEQTEADARLAETKARNVKAQRTVAELRTGIQTLQQELQRKTTPSAPVVTPLPGGTTQ